jgi:hypothetical protein
VGIVGRKVFRSWAIGDNVEKGFKREEKQSIDRKKVVCIIDGLS